MQFEWQIKVIKSHLLLETGAGIPAKIQQNYGVAFIAYAEELNAIYTCIREMTSIICQFINFSLSPQTSFKLQNEWNRGIGFILFIPSMIGLLFAREKHTTRVISIQIHLNP